MELETYVFVAQLCALSLFLLLRSLTPFKAYVRNLVDAHVSSTDCSELWITERRLFPLDVTTGTWKKIEDTRESDFLG